ncbi:MAG: threonine synthase [Cenarchaeum symbiont of Oopsacas minuta]|nr:threonine synthase [Cenarchaeum symbiont of Oopsacas minuta]
MKFGSMIRLAESIILQCRECKKEYTPEFRYVCDECFGPLDVKYPTVRIEKDRFANREQTYWRYHELLPILEKSNIVNISAGMTPLVHAKKLGAKLGLDNLYIKNDSVNPTFSFKDRPAGVAVSKSIEFGLSSVGCASTGNLASATAAHAAKAGLPCHIFAPADIEHAKIVQALSYGAEYHAIDGTYDDANRMAAMASDRSRIGIVNINMRSYYVEGSKTLAYEAAEQLGWKVPDHLVVPVGSGAMLNAICKGFEELESASLLGTVENMHVTAAQPKGCAPIVDAYENNSEVKPIEKPETVAKSLAIGDPGDGKYVIERIKQYNGYAAKTTDKEILDAILILAKTEGIFTEPAGGVSVSVLQRMVGEGIIDRTETVVCYVTGNGLKATEPLMDILPTPIVTPKDNKLLAVIK